MFAARYPGRCAGCPEPIVEGEVITLGERNEPLHVDCAGGEESITGRREPAVCPRCFIAHAGECF